MDGILVGRVGVREDANGAWVLYGSAEAVSPLLRALEIEVPADG